MSAGLPFMKNPRALLAKSVLILLVLPATTRATDTVIQDKIFANEEMDNIMKIVKFLEDSGLLMKDVNETIKNESKAKRLISLHVITYIKCYFIGKCVSKQT